MILGSSAFARASLVPSRNLPRRSQPRRSRFPELTAKAGVSRTTFYKHADSPPQLLASHLITQIRPVMDPMTTLLKSAEEDYLLRWRDIMVDLTLEHVRDNQAIYSHVFVGEGESVVLSILTRYFERIYVEYVEDFAEHVGDETATEAVEGDGYLAAGS